ncbi:tumor protein p53-inducible nuclear protein 1 isoform A [Alligator mississippiensis]|uniref:Tumor protein p53-inducible nuclear protein 1 isoform A n=1 Tax=Alligator mississippiensis TaxID=8496 RepID=A0A151MXY2_ALLMI|nr:tumor protein p53-inducible nuclear protein 1 isoform A [Alligator mississippiensis]
MFQRLNNMLVGEINNLSSQEPEFSEKEDEEWILVDFIDTCTNFSTEEEDISETSASDTTPVFSCLPTSLECLADATGGLTTIKVETSPMENLLIEHPSMSVYAIRNTCHSLDETSCGDEEFHNQGSPRARKSCLTHTGTNGGTN